MNTDTAKASHLRLVLKRMTMREEMVKQLEQQFVGRRILNATHEMRESALKELEKIAVELFSLSVQLTDEELLKLAENKKTEIKKLRDKTGVSKTVAYKFRDFIKRELSNPTPVLVHS